MTISKNGEVKKLDLLTGLGAARHIDEAIEEDTEFVFIPGAFTNSVISDISTKNINRQIRTQGSDQDIHKSYGLGKAPQEGL